MSSPIKPPFQARTDRALPPRFFGLLKATSVFLATALLTQGITAGFLMSDEDGRRLHGATGAVVTFALILQIVAALLVWRAGRGSVRYLAVTALLFVFTSVQFMVGSSGNVAVHVPLGVALFGAGAVLMAQIWTTRPAD
ncbi:hypothetical protein [Actinomadura kijaniata]|uniref:hypothetical protein n=1 Tax=Actinomadura kijaniata TaxID=46161 RepID=UPI0008331B7D|nr:hypothetical protein [Actinomadura kijaniata]